MTPEQPKPTHPPRHPSRPRLLRVLKAYPIRVLGVVVGLPGAALASLQLYGMFMATPALDPEVEEPVEDLRAAQPGPINNSAFEIDAGSFWTSIAITRSPRMTSSGDGRLSFRE